MFQRIFLLLFLFISCMLHGQEPYLYFNRINTQNGLSNNKVNCILQDQRGFIWIGTDDGLNRYDGHNFTIFRHLHNDSSTISGNIIKDIHEDDKGILWIATEDGGLTRYDYRQPPRLQFKQYRHFPGDSLSIPVNRINALLEDEQGYLWLASNGNAVLRFDKETEGFVQPIVKGTTNTLTFCLDKKNILWVGRQGSGLLKVDIKKLTTYTDSRYLNLYAKLPHVTVTSLYRDRQNHIWYGSWDRILYRYNETTRQEEAFSIAKEDKYSFPHDDIQAFAEDADGRIWMAGRYNGLTVYDPKQNKFFNYRYNTSREGTIADNHLNCIYIDKAGITWIGTAKGLSVYNPSQLPFVQTFLSEGYKELNIYDIFFGSNRDLYVGTNEGIYFRKAGALDFQQIKLTYQGRPLSVTKFLKEDEDHFFIGTNFSVFRYNLKTQAITLLPNTERDHVMYNIIDSRVVAMVRDTVDGHPALMVSPIGHFISYYDFIEQRWISRTDSVKNIVKDFNLKDYIIRKLYRTADGKIWLATGKFGLAEWGTRAHNTRYWQNDPLRDESISNDNITDIAADKSGNLWVATYGGGLNYFDLEKEKFHHIASAKNLVEGLSLDSLGNVWMTSEGNLHKYDLKEKTYTTFNLPDLEKSGGVKGSIFKDGDGTMFVAGNNYFIQLKPEAVPVNHIEPKIVFTDFRIFDSSYSQLLQQDKIRLNHNQNYFTIEFSAPDFSGSPILFSYMLEGVEKKWTEPSERNIVNYSNLAGGTYTFKVRATIGKEGRLHNSTAITIVIVPPFWKTWWFFLICLVLVISMIYGIYRYRINELLHLQAIRNKIAQDLHDHVGSTLSSISVYSQVAQIYQQQDQPDDLFKTLRKISETSGEMISEMNDIVWAINPRNDSMERILQRMESFARPLLQSKNIGLNLNHDPSLLDLHLSMNQRKNFYLVFKEAVNNALKYSDCANLSVRIAVKNREVDLSIADDGKGFDVNMMKAMAAKSLSGNGLVNMKRRAEDLNGRCLILSEPGVGTTIRLIFPIT